MSLRDDQVRRYSRHILLPDVGGVGQARLLEGAARVAVGPSRAAGAVALAYLAAAGVGTLVLTDDARGPVTEAELADNILLGSTDLGRQRLAALRGRLEALNPDVRAVPGDEAPAESVDVPIDEEPAPGDVAGAFVAGGAAAVRALVGLTRGS